MHYYTPKSSAFAIILCAPEGSVLADAARKGRSFKATIKGAPGSLLLHPVCLPAAGLVRTTFHYNSTMVRYTNIIPCCYVKPRSYSCGSQIDTIDTLFTGIATCCASALCVLSFDIYDTILVQNVCF